MSLEGFWPGEVVINTEENKKIEIAASLVAAGKTSEAIQLVSRLRIETKSAVCRLQCVSMLISILNKAQNNEQIIGLCDEGSRLASALNDLDSVACLKAMKASCLNYSVSLCLYRRSNLKMLAPEWRWVGFGLESEEAECNELEKRIARYETESDELIQQALEHKSDRPEIIGHIWNLRGQIYSGKYSNYKISQLRWKHSARFFKWAPIVKDWLLYTSNERQQMAILCDTFRESYRYAISAYRGIYDIEGEAMSLLNLILGLVDVRLFREADRCLLDLKRLAKQRGSKDLDRRVDWVEKRIQTKNKCIPNYVEIESDRNLSAK